MATRYQQLRQIVARLAASADEQHAYLERIFEKCSASDSWAYGNDELALELEDIFIAAGEMREWGEITEQEIEAVKPLDSLLLRWSGEAHSDFWRREALWDDQRWEEVRACAGEALAALPDEERASGWLDAILASRLRDREA